MVIWPGGDTSDLDAYEGGRADRQQSWVGQGPGPHVSASAGLTAWAGQPVLPSLTEHQRVTGCRGPQTGSQQEQQKQMKF